MNETTQAPIRNEHITPVGAYILVKHAKKIEVKTQSNLVIPDGQGGVRRAPQGKAQKEVKAAEFVIEAIGEGRDETERPLLEGLKVGMRIAVGNATLIPIYRDGVQFFMLDALNIVAIVDRPDPDSETPSLETTHAEESTQ